MPYRLTLSILLVVVLAVSSQAQATAFLGVAVGEPSGEKAKGAAVVEVLPDSPAAKSGLVEGDVILAVNGVKIKTPKELVETIQSLKTGDEVKLKVRRDGEKRKVTVTLGERPETLFGPDTPARPPRKDPRPMIGIAFGAPASFDRPEEPDSFVIVTVFAGSPAEEAGIKEGDVLVEVDGKKVEGYKQLIRQLRNKKAGDKVVLKIERDGETIEKKVTLKVIEP